ncbi:MAG: transcriptional repressor [Anaerolineae bacterium]
MWDERRAASLPLAQAMAHAGLKLTRPRLAIAQVLSETSAHLSATEIWEAARRLHPPLGRATAFRTINQLVALALLRPAFLGGSEMRYITVSEGHHHHIICTQCGTIAELAPCPLEPQELTLPDGASFEITGHLVEFYGICPDCRADAD